MYYLSNSPKRHEHVDSLYWAWIDDVAKAKITGPDGLLFEGDAFSVPQISLSKYTHPVWSSSRSGVTINGNGVVTNVNSCGYVTITYNNSNGSGAYIRKTKTIMAGFPSMCLNATKGLGLQYQVEATCTSNYSSFQNKLDSLANNGSIGFIWGTKQGNGAIEWVDTTSVRTWNINVSYGELKRVYMKIRSSSGAESSDLNYVDIDRRPQDMFSYDPKNIVISRGGEWFSYTLLIRNILRFGKIRITLVLS